MTHQQKLEAIRRACVKANPKIVELKPGCEFYQKNRKTDEVLSDAVYVFLGRGIDSREINFSLTDRYARDEIGRYDGYAYNEVQSEKNLEGYIEIIGRPIRLADVLLVFRGRSLKGCDPNETYPSRNEISILQRWNIRNDDLSKQSEDTVDFIHGLLKGV